MRILFNTRLKMFFAHFRYIATGSRTREYNIYISIYITNNTVLTGTRFSTNSVPVPSVHDAPAYYSRQSSFNTLRENRSCGAKAASVVHILCIPRPARSLGGRGSFVSRECCNYCCINTYAFSRYPR